MSNVYDVALIVNGDRRLPNIRRGKYKKGLSGSKVYEAGSLVRLASDGTVERADGAGAAALGRVFMSTQAYNIPHLDMLPSGGADPHWIHDPVILDRLTDEVELHGAFVAGAAAGADYALVQAGVDLVESGARVTLRYDQAFKAHVLTSTTTAPNVQILGWLGRKPELGTVNPRVRFRILPDFIG